MLLHKRINELYFGVRNLLPILIFIVLISTVILYGLDGTYLWKDEAGTANVSYNVLTYGLPKVYDGKNLLSTSDGNNFNSEFLVSNHEWLQYYICAASFGIFGKNTFAARFPFALFAIASVYIIWLLSKRIYKTTFLSIMSCVIYACNVQFLLYARQARYYSLIMFFTSLSALLFLKNCDIDQMPTEHSIRKKLVLYSGLFLSSSLLFFSNRLAGAVLVGATICYSVVYHDKRVLKAGIPVLAGILPWGCLYLINNILLQAPNFGGNGIESHFFTKILLVIWKLQVYFCPILLLVLIAVVFQVISVARGNRERNIYNRETTYFIFIVFCNVVLTAIPKWGIVNHYFVPVLVAIPFIVVPIIKLIYKNSRLITAFFVILILLTNVLNILPYGLLGAVPEEKNEVNNLLSEQYAWTTNYGIFASPETNADFRTTSLNSYKDKIKVRCYLLEYFGEIKNGYYSSIQEICEHINKNSKPTDTVLVIGTEYEPIVFYTGLRVVNNLSTKLRPWNDYFDQYPNQEKYGYLTQVEDEEIDWVIVKKDISVSLFLEDPDYLNNNISRFDIYTSKTSDIPLSNSPDLDYHKFETVVNEPGFTILHRK